MERILLRRIVCAVDLSDRSAAALKYALLLARLHGAELRVVHVKDVPTGSVQRSIFDAFLHLRRLAETGSDRRTAIRWIVAHGNPAIELARYVRSANADLVVIGRSLPRPATGVVSTVAEAVLRAANCPVLVIPKVTDGDVSPRQFHEILCSLSSGLSTATLRYALSLAQEFESRLSILNVENPDQFARSDHRLVPSDIDHLRTAIPDTAYKWSEIDEFVGTGDPVQELARLAERLHPNLVVVGSTAAPAFNRALGSVALGALALTEASVLIVPTSELLREADASPTHFVYG